MVSTRDGTEMQKGETVDVMAHRAMATAAKHASQTRTRASVGSSRSTKDVTARAKEACRRTGAAVVPAVVVRREWKVDEPLTWKEVGNPRARAYETPRRGVRDRPFFLDERFKGWNALVVNERLTWYHRVVVPCVSCFLFGPWHATLVCRA